MNLKYESDESKTWKPKAREDITFLSYDLREAVSKNTLNGAGRGD